MIQSMRKQKEVLVLGAGFGGVFAAKTVLKEHNGNFHVTLIDKNSYHTYTSDLYEVATAFIEEPFGKGSTKADFSALKSIAALPLRVIFPQRAHITIRQGAVIAIDIREQTAFLSNGEKLPYDYLVVALGSETNFFDIPNLREHSLQLKSTTDAVNIRNTIDELFTSTPKHKKIRIVIGGGGFTGCEFAGELMGYIRKLAHIHGHPKGHIECTIVEAASSILPAASLWVQKKATRRLQKLGVRVITNATIVDVSNREIVLKKGMSIPYTLLVWAAGVRANTIAEGLAGAEMKRSCLVIDNHLRVKPFKNVYVVGDMMYCFYKERNIPLPATAQTAIQQGIHAARHIISNEAKKKIAPYKPLHPIFVVPLGGRYALADLKWIRFSGYAAWFLKRLIALRYFLKVVSFRQAVHLCRTGTCLYKKNN